MGMPNYHNGQHRTMWHRINHVGVPHRTAASSALRLVLGVLQHPGWQFWEPTINGSGKILCAG